MSDFLEFQVPSYTVYDNIVTTVFQKNFPTTSFARVYVQAAAVRPGNGDHRTLYRTVSIIRSGGAPTLSTVVDVHAAIGTAGSSTWNLTFALSGNDVQVQITGQSGATTIWMLKITVFFLKED
jgi:hypothetical protein